MQVVAQRYLIALYFSFVYAGQPPECRQKFNHRDCGLPPQPVFQYYLAGERCAVTEWRGCRPNLNMFSSEHECVDTCVFHTKVGPADYHRLKEIMPIVDQGSRISEQPNPAGGPSNGTTGTEASIATNTTTDNSTTAGNPTTAGEVTTAGNPTTAGEETTAGNAATAAEETTAGNAATAATTAAT